MSTSLWSLVLAAGAGRRLASVTGGVPKQFWSPDGGPTLLESTLSRTAPLAASDRTVVVVDRAHAPHLSTPTGHRRDGGAHWIFQWCDRGTAAGVLLGLTYIAERDRDAVVLLTPSDQGVSRPDTFAQGVRRALGAVEGGATDLVLFGVTPDRPTVDYGWIAPAGSGGNGLAPVAGFVEKPRAAVARALYKAGAVWNTMVLVGRVTALLALYVRHVPALVDAWGQLPAGGPHGTAAIGADYESLPSADFSRDVLGPASGLSVYVWPATMGWSDLGTPDRLAAWHAANVRIDRTRWRDANPALSTVEVGC